MSYQSLIQKVASPRISTTHQTKKTQQTEATGTPEERIIQFEYLSSDINLVTRVLEPSVVVGQNKETLTTYDADLNITSKTVNGFHPGGSAVSRSFSYSYNNVGQVIQIDGPRTGVSDVSTITYHDCSAGGECGQVNTLVNALGHTYSYNQYDVGGLLSRSTDVNGVSEVRQYDARQRLVSTLRTPPEGEARLRQITYTAAGDVEKIYSEDGVILTFAYDDARNRLSRTDNNGNKIVYGYDLKGNVTSTIVESSAGLAVRSTITSYNHRNQVTAVDRAGSVTQIAPDANGNVLSITDPKLNPATSDIYDALNRMVSSTDSNNGLSTFDFDAHDNLVQVDSPNGASTSFVYDDLGNLIREVSPDRGQLDYAHDDAGNVIQMQDARGVIVNYTYDALNRVTFIDYPGNEEDVTLIYDSFVTGGTIENCAYGIGRLCRRIDQSGESIYSYDPWGNLLTSTWSPYAGSAPYIVSYEYTRGDQVASVTYPTGRSIQYDRDAVQRIEQASVPNTTDSVSIVAARSYRADGLVTEQTYGNGILETRNYDLQGRLVQQVVDGRITDYAYDANGNVTAITKNQESRQYTFDTLDRLLSDQKQDQFDSISDFDFQYDGNGNRLQSIENNTDLTSYTYLPDSNQLSDVEGTSVPKDASGRQLIHNGLTLEYNQSGRLSRVFDNTILIAEYRYNADGLRTYKHLPQAGYSYHYVYHPNGSLLYEMADSVNSHQVEYIWVDRELAAIIRTDA